MNLMTVFPTKIKDVSLNPLTKRILLHCVIAITCVLIFILSDVQLNVDKASKMLNSLQNVTAAIFTLTGIWLAISYPEAIKTYINPKKVSLMKGSIRTQRIEKIVLTILGAAYALSLTILLQWSETVLSGFSLSPYINKIFILVYGSLLAYITIVVLRGLWSIMYVNFQITNELHDKKDEAEAYDDISQ